MAPYQAAPSTLLGRERHQQISKRYRRRMSDADATRTLAVDHYDTGSSRFGTDNQGGAHRSRGMLRTTLTEVSKPTTDHPVPMWLDQKASLLIGL
jgi:hypothetical protein